MSHERELRRRPTHLLAVLEHSAGHMYHRDSRRGSAIDTNAKG